MDCRWAVRCELFLCSLQASRTCRCSRSARRRPTPLHSSLFTAPCSQLPVHSSRSASRRPTPLHSSLFTAPYSQLPLGEQAANAEAQEAALPKKAIAAHDMLSDPTLSKEHAVDPEELAQKLRKKASLAEISRDEPR